MVCCQVGMSHPSPVYTKQEESAQMLCLCWERQNAPFHATYHKSVLALFRPSADHHTADSDAAALEGMRFTVHLKDGHKVCPMVDTMTLFEVYLCKCMTCNGVSRSPAEGVHLKFCP